MQTTTQSKRESSTSTLIVFWAYVLVPLTWGVVNTLTQAMKLFS